MLSHKTAPPDTQLVRRIVQGDREALAALYDSYSKPLYSFALRVLRDPQEAQDVLQNVFLQIWEKGATFDESLGRPFTWAVAMTRNQAIDRLRARQRCLPLFEEAAAGAVPEEATGEPPLADSFGNDQPTPIRAAVHELPKEQRRAIELAFFGGLTHPEMAAALQEPPGTIRARIRRGMLRLRDGPEGAL